MTMAVQITARGERTRIEAAAAAIEAAPALDASAYAVIEEDEARGLWRLDLYPVSQAEAEALTGLVGRWPGLRVSSRPLADADWLALALSGLPPVRAGRFVVHGAHDRGRVPANAVGLRIEAGAAFGTGHHGTTLGCLLALDGLLRRRRPGRVLDVGTGTGVLAIAAARAGAEIAIGADIDPVAVRIAGENARLNGAGARSRFVRADGLGGALIGAAAPYDLVFANILAGPLVRLAPAIRRALAPGGVVILSGLLRSQERQVLAAYGGLRLRLVRRIHLDAWATLVLRSASTAALPTRSRPA
ncbi:MAG TPA: 50S ribosomal protein L11 methyltransferase [Caulobacteraceae bacterium]|nr:50S ribosomal protein L11 methyltransferase [Caulobacteraceae bacterium]